MDQSLKNFIRRKKKRTKVRFILAGTIVRSTVPELSINESAVIETTHRSTILRLHLGAEEVDILLSQKITHVCTLPGVPPARIPVSVFHVRGYGVRVCPEVAPP